MKVAQKFITFPIDSFYSNFSVLVTFSLCSCWQVVLNCMRASWSSWIHSTRNMNDNKSPKRFWSHTFLDYSVCYNCTFNFPQVLLEMNLAVHDINSDDYTKAVMNSSYDRYDLTLLVLSKLLKVIIGVIHPDYIWLSTPDVNVLEASVIFVYDGNVLIQGTGMSLETVSLLFIFQIKSVTTIYLISDNMWTCY